MNDVEFLAVAVRAFNSTTGEQLEVYGQHYDEILKKLEAAGVPQLDIINSSLGFLMSIDKKMPQFFDYEDAMSLMRQADTKIINTKILYPGSLTDKVCGYEPHDEGSTPSRDIIK